MDKYEKKDLIYSEQQTLFGAREIIGFGSDDWHVKEINRNLANELILKNHYSKKFYNASYIHLGVFICGELLGVLQYGYAMNPASGGSVVEGTQKDEYLELNRMWLDDKAERNSETKAISYSLKYIRSKFPKIKWIQSFADERCKCFGIVYQAASFSFYGEHKALFYYLDGEVFHNLVVHNKGTGGRKITKKEQFVKDNLERATSETLRQFRYIKFLDKRWKKKCLLKEKPYPKHYNGD
jgi:hypothetical protein